MKNRTLARFTILFGCLLILGTSGCGDPEVTQNLSLIDDEPDLSDEQARRTRKEALTLVHAQTGQEYLIQSGWAGSWATATCNTAHPGTVTNFLNAKRRFCVARFLDSISGINPNGLTIQASAGAPISYYDGDDIEQLTTGSYRIPPQSTFSKYSASLSAWSTYREAIGYAKNAILSDLGALADADTEKVVSVYVDSYYSALEANRRLVDFALALSESERSSTTSVRVGQERATYYRTKAAREVINFNWGQETLPKPFDIGFCSAERLTGGKKKALDILRETGVSPADVVKFVDFDTTVSAEVSLESLVDGVGGEPPGGSVRRRLELMWDVSWPTGHTVGTYMGIEQSDFAAARRYLAEEIRGLARSKTASLGDLGSGLTRFAGVSEAKPHRGEHYVTALMRNSFSPSSAALGARPLGTATPSVGSDDEFAGFVDFSVSWATYFERNLVGASTIERDAIQGQMNLLRTGGDRAGRLTYCYGDGNPGDGVPADARAVHLYAYGWKSTDGLIVVAGEDAMECAVYGNIEGASCSYTAASQFNQPGSPEPGFRSNGIFGTVATRKEGNFGGPLWLDAGLRERWYLLKPRASSSVVGNPGDYQVLTGFVPHGGNSSGPPNFSTTSPRECVDVPVVPEAFEMVDRLLSPSSEWCGEQRLSCAGTSFDERLPLENELSDDGDGIESSWRYYLGLARQAADEADRLGVEYIESTIATKTRQENEDRWRFGQAEKAVSELQKLQEICGTAVDVPQLLASITNTAPTGQSASSDLRINDCASGQSLVGCQGNEFSWQNALDSDDSYSDLLECIRSFDGTVPYVHLGDATLCAWTMSGTTCGGTSTRPCPFVLPAGTTCAAEVPVGASPITVPSTAGLQFFETSKYAKEVRVGADPCDGIRRARQLIGGSPSALGYQLARDAIQKLVDDGFFNATQLDAARQQVSFQARYGGYAAVLINGYPKYETGEFSTGPETSDWPCGGNGKASNCGGTSGGTGFLCDFNNLSCSTESGRAYINHRMLEAVLAAQYLAQSPYSQPVRNELPIFFLGGDLASPVRGTIQNPAGNISINEWKSIDFKQYLANIDSGLVESHAYATPDGLGGVSVWFLNPGVTVFTGDNMVPYEFDVTFGTWKTAIYAEAGNDNGHFFSGLSSRPSSYSGYFDSVLRGLSRVEDVPSGTEIYMITGARPSSSEQTYVEAWQELGLIHPAEDTIGGQSWVHMGQTEEDYLHGFAELPDLPNVYASRGGNGGGPAKYSLGSRALFDGLELLCEAHYGDEAAGCSSTVPEFETLADLTTMGKFMECKGAELKHSAATAVFQKFPKSALDPLRMMNGAGVYESAQGTIGSRLADLRQALQQVSTFGPQIGGHVRSFGNDMIALQSTLEIYDLKEQMTGVRFQATKSAETASCLAGIAGAGSAGMFAGFAAAAAAVKCVDSLNQVGFADQLRQLENESLASERETVIADFNSRFDDGVTALTVSAAALKSALENVNRYIGEIESEKQRARRSVSHALWLLSLESKHTQPLNSLSSARDETARVRYERAHQNAKRYAYLAKRAVEARLGVRLADMKQELPLVAAPQTWEGSICATEGLDLREEVLESLGETKHFADTFVGQYVDNLENVVESYRLEYGFVEGGDRLVASLRDDVLGVKQWCQRESPNLLLHTRDFDAIIGDSSAKAGVWFASGCDSFDEDCLGLSRIVGSVPFVTSSIERKPVSSWALTFGAESDENETAVLQRVELPPGRYVLSWYTPDELSGDGAAAGVVRPVTETDMVAVVQDGGNSRFVVEGGGADWNRVFVVFDVGRLSTIEVGFEKTQAGVSEISIAAPMLEKVMPNRAAGEYRPRTFVGTDANRLSSSRSCVDADGSQFRSQAWTYACQKSCEAGLGSACSTDEASRCFWETSFYVNQRHFGRGNVFGYGGMARDNFNYRLSGVAVNFVGTGLRNCADSDAPHACAASGFLPYSLYHGGPYYVTNHWGLDFEVPLFVGRIEHARGLAAERYLTSPMGSADVDLVAQFERNELTGRPFDGEFVLRVWDEPGVDFSKLEDVQLVLDYRYWTRNN